MQTRHKPAENGEVPPNTAKTKYQVLNERNRYQLLRGDIVACEEWMLEANGGKAKGGRTVFLIVPLPDCPPDKYDNVMRLLRERSIQMVRGKLKEQGMPSPIRLRIAHVKPTYVPASQIDWEAGR